MPPGYHRSALQERNQGRPGGGSEKHQGRRREVPLGEIGHPVVCLWQAEMLPQGLGLRRTRCRGPGPPVAGPGPPMRGSGPRTGGSGPGQGRSGPPGEAPPRASRAAAVRSARSGGWPRCRLRSGGWPCCRPDAAQQLVEHGLALVLVCLGLRSVGGALRPLVAVLSRAIGDANATSVILGATIGVLAAVPQFLSLIRWPFLIPLPRARARGSEGARRLRTAPIRAKRQRAISA